MFRDPDTSSDQPTTPFSASAAFDGPATGKNLISPDEAVGRYFKSQLGFFGGAFEYQRIELPSGVILHIAETRALETFSIKEGSNEDPVRAMAYHVIEQRRRTKELQGIPGYVPENTKPFYCALWVGLRPAVERQNILTSEKTPITKGSIYFQEMGWKDFEMQNLLNAQAQQKIATLLGDLFRTNFKPSKVSYPAPKVAVA